MQVITEPVARHSSQQIKHSFFSDPQFIKKSKINYLNCNLKGLHQGEKLALVCLDKNCKCKGLICPVCKEQSHKDHQVVHLKIFLSELQSKMIKTKVQEQQDEASENKQFTAAKTLAEYLNNLQNARKAIITNLQQSVKLLAQAVKDVQKKIQDEYIRIRRIILSQKSFQSRLPKIYNYLLLQDFKDQKHQQEMKQQIQKLTQLLETNSKKDQTKVANNSDKIVQLYVKNLDTCTTHLLSLMTDLPKKISELPIKLKNIMPDEEEKNKQKPQKLKYKFDQNLKATSIILSQDLKSVSVLGPQQLGGVTFLDAQGEAQVQVRKVNLKITSSVSDSISLGVGNVDKMKQLSFVVQQMENEGLFGICAMGININDIQSPTFVFAQGDIIQIQFDVKNCLIIFGRRNGVEKQEIQINHTQQQCKKFKFFVNVILYGDSVEIVE